MNRQDQSELEQEQLKACRMLRELVVRKIELNGESYSIEELMRLSNVFKVVLDAERLIVSGQEATPK